MAQKSAKFQAKPDEDGSQVKDQESDKQTPEEIAQRKFVKPKDEAKTTDSPQKKSISKPSGLFANLAQSTPTTSQTSLLFNNTNITPPAANTGTNLFQSSGLFGKATTNVFGNAATGLFCQPQTGGLFGNTSNLFSNTPQAPITPTGGLFSINFSNASKKDEDDEDGEGGEDDVASQKSDDEQKEIIMKHDYQKTTDQILKVKQLFLMVEKKNQNDVLEKGTIALEQVIETQQHLVIYRNQINAILYTGFVYPGISSVANLNNKEENLIVKLISIQDNAKDSKTKLQKDTIKLMFTSGDEANKFKFSLVELCEKKEENKKQEVNGDKKDQ